MSLNHILPIVKTASKEELLMICKIYNLNVNKTLTKKQLSKYISESLLFKKLEVYAAGIQGKRKYMEDKFFTIKMDFDLLSCIFDGHGGSACSVYFNDNFYTKFMKNKYKYPNIKNAMLSTVKDMNQTFISKFKDKSGSTINIFYLDLITKKCHNINLGDSRSIVGYKNGVKVISKDHKPHLKAEQKYIERKGGNVIDNRVQGILAMSRSVGDKDISKYLNDTPNYYSIDITSDMIFFLHASDGLFDVMSNNEIYDFVTKRLKNSIEVIVSELIKYAFEKGSSDNISVSLILTNGIII